VLKSKGGDDFKINFLMSRPFHAWFGNKGHRCWLYQNKAGGLPTVASFEHAIRFDCKGPLKTIIRPPPAEIY